MMPHCLANGCSNRGERSDPSVSFHAFPADVPAAQRWADRCGVSGDDLAALVQDVLRGRSGKYQLCSLHFEERDFEGGPVQPVGVHPAGAQPVVAQPAGAQPEPAGTQPEPVGVQPVVAHPAGTQPEPTAVQPVGAQLEPTGAQHAGAQPTIAQPEAAGAQPVGAQLEPVGSQPEPARAHPEPAGAQPVVAQPAGAQPESAGTQPEPTAVQPVGAQLEPTGAQHAGAQPAIAQSEAAGAQPARAQLEPAGAQPAIAELEPVVAHPEPATAQPAGAKPEPATVHPEPTGAEPAVAQPAGAQPEPAGAHPEPAGAEPAVAHPEPAVAQPAEAQSEPATVQPEPVGAQPAVAQPAGAQSEPAGAHPEPAGAHPAGAHPEPAGAQLEPVGAQPAIAHPEPVVAHPEPTIAQPAEAHPEPAAVQPEPTGAESAVARPAGDQPEPTEDESAVAQPAGDQPEPTEDESAVAQPAGDQPEPTEDESAVAQPAGDQPEPTEDESAVAQPAGDQPEPTEDESAVAQPAGDQPEPTEDEPAVAQPEPAGAQSVGAQPEPTGAGPAVAQPEPAGAQSVGAQPVPTEDEPAVAQLSGAQSEPAGAQHAGDEPAVAQPAGAHPEPAGAHPEPAGAHPEPAGAHPAGAHPEPVGAHPTGAQRKLRQNAEPTLLLNTPPTHQDGSREHREQRPAALPDPERRERESEAGSLTSTCCSCSAPRTSRTAQIASPRPERAPKAETEATGPGAGVSHGTTQTAGHSSQSLVNQIVLNFLEQHKKVPAENVPVVCVSQCRAQGVSHSPQPVVKQIVLIFLEHPSDSAQQSPPSSSQGPPRTVSSGTQTEAGDEQLRKPKDEAESPPLLPQRPSQSNSRSSCETCCLTPSLNQYVGSLLEQHKDSVRETILSPCVSASNSLCECSQSQPLIRQIVLNILEQELRPAKQAVPSPGTSSDPSPPACSGHQHTDRQAREEYLQDQLRKPKDETGSHLLFQQRPSQSSSRSPCETCCLEPSLNQEDQRDPAAQTADPCPSVSEPQSSLHNHNPTESRVPVTFNDVAVYFCKAEWQLLKSRQKELYREVMRDNYEALISLGYPVEKPDLVTRMEQEQQDLWDSDPVSRSSYSYPGEEEWGFLGQDIDGVSCLDVQPPEKNLCAPESGAPRSSSHLGALMRLVNEIPEFLLGSPVTEGSPSPAGSLENQTDTMGPSPDGHKLLGLDVPLDSVKTEESSPVCTPVPVKCLMETPGNGCAPNSNITGDTEQIKSEIRTKGEEGEVAIATPSRLAVPVNRPQGMSLGNIGDPAVRVAHRELELRIKPEEPPSYSPVHDVLGGRRDHPTLTSRSSNTLRYTSQSPGGRESRTPDTGSKRVYAEAVAAAPWRSVPPSRSLGMSFGYVRVSPGPAWDSNASVPRGETQLGIKQEASESKEHRPGPAVCARKLPRPPTAPSPGLVQQDKDLRRLVAPIRRSPADLPLGNSHLHGLVNCLKEISGSRPRPYSTFFTAAPVQAPRGPELNRTCAESAIRASVSPVSRAKEIPPGQPNPFTVSAINGASREHRVTEAWDGRLWRDEGHRDSFPLPAPGKCRGKIPTYMSSNHNAGGVGTQSEEHRRPDMGVKRSHSDADGAHDVSHRSRLKRAAVESSSPSRAVTSCSPGHRDLWRPPEELTRPHAEDNPGVRSHLMSVMNCVRKIPTCRPGHPTAAHCSSARVTAANRDPTTDQNRTSTQGSSVEGTHSANRLHRKESKEQTPTRPALNVWMQPPSSPSEWESPARSAKNIHLSGLMKLMEEIPVSESSSSSRAMYSIAVGRSEARTLERRPERTVLSPYSNHDGFFHPESNDNTVASVDSILSDDTSWSSENVDPSYSAIDGLQKVVSEFAELGSRSPLIAVTAPPVSSSIQEGSGHRKRKESVTGPSACPPRLNESARGLRDLPVPEGRRCSAENGEVSHAALCGLLKVVRGFSQQECVSPFSAVRTQPSNSTRDIPAKKGEREEEGDVLCPQYASPARRGSFLCDYGNWPAEIADSSYSALSGLQKVVNGFSDIGCISPFSAVSTAASEGTPEISSTRRKSDQPNPVEAANAPENMSRSAESFLADEDWPVGNVDSSYSALTGLQKVVNGVPDVGSLSPLTVVSNPSSDGAHEPSAKRRCERSDEDVWQVSPRSLPERQSYPPRTVTVTSDHGRGCGLHCSPSKKPAPRGHCIDLTEEDEPVCDKDRVRPEQPPLREATDPHKIAASRSQCIDLTEEEPMGVVNKAKALIPDAGRGKSFHGASTRKPSSAVKWNNPCIDLTREERGRRMDVDKPLDPGSSGQAGKLRREGVSAVNEHLSGLEKLLKDMPAFGSRPPSNNPSVCSRNGTWWFKSTSPHET
ncbi:uncharacterized protein LOC142487972 isoform X4 [Ascaphus truei]|uniref:uncharacterized protein LOC142487972 isoform X4 n=1 Tax=Ascaphus truei TaxID=8439 RepID=UPI003F598E17